MLNSSDKGILSLRARRARSSLYAGGVVHKQSIPIRTKSEDVNSRSPPDDRKKSHTSTQSTTIDTPPKTPPLYGNTLTVGLPEIIDTITDFEKNPLQPKNQDQLTIHRESDEFDLDDIDNGVSFIEENKDKKPNGLHRPGTPVKRAPPHAVRFVKPTLTVTTDPKAAEGVNESFEDSENEDGERRDGVDAAKSGRAKKRPWSPVRNAGVAPMRTDETDT